MSGALPWVVCDLETTGLHPAYHHRAVEIALVTGLGDQIEEEWSTLLCPDRDIGAGEIHGLFGKDLKDAPRFADIAGAVIERICGRVVVAHNARFDAAFIEAEFERAGISCPDVPWLCTLDLVRSLGLVGGRLADCCQEFGLPAFDAHTALGDAETCAQLLLACLPHVQLDVTIPSAEEWPTVPCSVDPRCRQSVPKLRESYLCDLVRTRPSVDVGSDHDAAAYCELLDGVLEDRQVTSQEATELAGCAELLGLSAAQIEQTHRAYLTGLVAQAWADGVVTDRERRDLDCVSELLAVELSEIEVQAPAVPTATGSEPPSCSLSGLSVCFTGALMCTHDGQLLTRERAQSLAARAGLEISPRVTQKLDILVVADPDSLSGKARKAREYGTRIIAEPAFWSMIGVEVA